MIDSTNLVVCARAPPWPLAVIAVAHALTSQCLPMDYIQHHCHRRNLFGHFFSWSVPGSASLRSQATHAFGFQAPNTPFFQFPVSLESPVLTDHLFSLHAMAALNLLHFFTGVEPARGSVIRRQEPRPLKVCKLCSYVDFFLISILLLTTSSEKYDSDLSMLPTVPRYTYSPNTGNANLWRHLYQVHPEEYDKAVSEQKWPYKLSRE